MDFAARLDDIGKPAWIGLTIVSFILFWPLGLVLLGYLVGSGRMACWAHGSGDRWQRRMERMQQRMERMQGAAERWSGRGYQSSSSGNRAFDEYRDETMRRLEEEQREFKAFLDRLRHAKDKVEFTTCRAPPPYRALHRSPQSARRTSRRRAASINAPRWGQRIGRRGPQQQQQHNACGQYPGDNPEPVDIAEDIGFPPDQIADPGEALQCRVARTDRTRCE